MVLEELDWFKNILLGYLKFYGKGFISMHFCNYIVLFKNRGMRNRRHGGNLVVFINGRKL